MSTTIGIAKNVSGVDQTTPFENGVSGSGGVLGYSSPVPFPTVTKTTTASLILARFGGKVAPGSSTSNFVVANPTGFSGTTNGPFTAPAAGTATMGSFFETTPAAAGTYSPTATTPGNTGGTAGRQIQSYAARISCLRPAVAGVAPVMRNTTLINTNASSFTVTLTATAAANPLTFVELHNDDPAATFTPPAGWVQAYRQTHTNGVLVGYYGFTGAAGPHTFDVSTSSVPTVNSAAAVSAPHSPALVGDTLNVDTNTSYSAPGGDPISLYERRPQILDPVNGWTDVSGAASTAATQGGLSTWTITSAADGTSVRYGSRAQNGAGWSDWSYSNAVTVLNPPVIASAPAIVTDGTPVDGETVTVNTSPTARSTRYTGQAIDNYDTKWQDNTGGSYTDLVGTAGTSSLLLSSAQVGYQVRFAERAHNASGYTAWNYSDPITVAVHPPIAVTDILVRYSGGTGNTDGSASIGGGLGGLYYRSGDDAAALLDDLFGAVLGTVAAAGGSFYRGVYFVNGHPIDPWANLKAFIGTQYDAPGLTVSVGVPTQAADTPLPTLASGTTAPAGVTFTTAGTAAAGQAFGSLGPGSYRGLWVKLAIAAGTPQLTVPGDFAAFSVSET